MINLKQNSINVKKQTIHIHCRNIMTNYLNYCDKDHIKYALIKVEILILFAELYLTHKINTRP
jgi:hypothetical protein